MIYSEKPGPKEVAAMRREVERLRRLPNKSIWEARALDELERKLGRSESESDLVGNTQLHRLPSAW